MHHEDEWIGRSVRDKLLISAAVMRTGAPVSVKTTIVSKTTPRRACRYATNYNRTEGLAASVSLLHTSSARYSVNTVLLIYSRVPRVLSPPCPLDLSGQLLEMLIANLFGMLNISALLLLVSVPSTSERVASQ